MGECVINFRRVYACTKYFVKTTRLFMEDYDASKTINFKRVTKKHGTRVCFINITIFRTSRSR